MTASMPRTDDQLFLPWLDALRTRHVGDHPLLTIGREERVHLHRYGGFVEPYRKDSPV